MAQSPVKPNSLFSEILIDLSRKEFDAHIQEDNQMEVSLKGQSICRITSSGAVRYKADDIRAAENEDQLQQITSSVRTITEYMKLMESAPPLNASSLDESYRLLAEFNSTVLAGHETTRGVQFVTWDWDFNKVGVNHGHYMGNDYEAAKQDFAIRSGLVQKNQFFSPEQLFEIYRCCADTLSQEFELTYEQERQINTIQKQITEMLPDFAERLKATLELDTPQQPTM